MDYNFYEIMKHKDYNSSDKERNDEVIVNTLETQTIFSNNIFAAMGYAVYYFRRYGKAVNSLVLNRCVKAY